jgi:hypothetical protein
MINHDVLRTMKENHGVDATKLKADILERKFNPETGIYYLLLRSGKFRAPTRGSATPGVVIKRTRIMSPNFRERPTIPRLHLDQVDRANLHRKADSTGGSNSKVKRVQTDVRILSPKPPSRDVIALVSPRENRIRTPMRPKPPSRGSPTP